MLGIIGIALQTSVVQTYIAATVSETLSDKKNKIQLTPITGLFPFDISFAHLSLADEQGIWLQLDNVRLNWSLLALFNGELKIDELSSQSLHLHRLPPSAPKKDEPLQIPTELPEIDLNLPLVNINRLAIESIKLGKSVIGEALELNFFAKAQTVGQKIAAELQLTRLDKDNLKLTLDAQINLKPLSITTKIRADETGGLLAKLTQQPALKSVHLQLDADGLLDNLAINLNSQIAGVGNLKQVLTFGISQQPWLKLATKAELTTGIIPKKILDLIGKQQNLSMHVIATDAENIQLKQLELNNELLKLAANLNLHLPDQKIALSTDLKLANLSKLNVLTGLKLAGATTLTATVNGTLEQPKAKLNLVINKLAVDDLQVKHLTTELNLVPETTVSAGKFNLTSTGTVTGILQAKKPIPEPNLSWDTQLNIDKKQQLQIKNFILDGAWSHVYVVGNFDLLKQAGELDLSLKLDNLAAITKAANAEIEAEAKIKIQPQLKQINVNLATNIQKLTGLPAPVKDLIGDKISLNTVLDLNQKTSLVVHELNLQAKKFNLIANKTQFNLNTQQFNSHLELAIPQLKTPEISLQKAKIKLDLQGKPTQPLVNAIVEIANLEVAQQKISAIKLVASAKEVMQNPQGQFKLQAQQYGQQLTLSSNYALQGQQLKLDKLLFAAPKTELAGQLVLNLDSILLQGDLKLKNTNLQALKPWTQQDLQGQLSLETSFKPIKQQQFVSLTTQLNKFALAELKINSIHLDAEVKNALKNPQLQAKLNLQELQQQDIKINNIQLDAEVKNALEKPELQAKLQLHKLQQQETKINKLLLTASGVLAELQLQLATQGKVQEPFTLNLQALLQHTNKQTQLHLEKFTGKFAKKALNMHKPTSVVVVGKNIALNQLDLSLGKIKLSAKMDYSPQKLLGQINLDFPLSVANQFTELPVRGKFSSEVKLSGSAIQPQINVQAQLKNLKLKGFEYRDFPATELTLETQIKAPQLNAEVKIKNPKFKQDFVLITQLPLQLQLEPFLFDMPENQAITGNLTADLDLEKLTRLLPLVGQQIKGNFNTKLQLSGSIKQPQLQGKILLEQGEYQNSMTETHFKNIQLQVDANLKEIKLTKLNLQDADTGTLTSSGLVSLDADKKFPVVINLLFKHLQLANSPKLNTHMSGKLNLTGNIEQALLKGNLAVDDFRFILPSSAGKKSIPELEIIEIGGNNRVKKSKTNKNVAVKTTKPKKDLALQLDVRIKIENQCFISGHGLESEWYGDLSVKGFANAPQILGQIQTKRGSLELLNNMFVFNRGLIDFNGAFPPIPSLDIQTAAETDAGKALINIRGMANNPKLVLSHDPVIPQDEIISNLLFKQDKKSISPMQALQLADAVNLMATGGFGGLDGLSSLRSGLGLDRLSVGGDNFETAAVKAGKYVTDSIYIEIEQGLGSESSTATVEIDLFPDIKAEVEFSQQSDSAVGIKWKHDY